MSDICIQIGNTDNKLTQQEWSEFCGAMRGLCEAHGDVHFSGGAPTDAPWQNYCLCVSTETPDALRELVTKRRSKHKQDSVAWLQGNTQFV